MKWFAKRFKYTRELGKRVRELEQEARALELIIKFSGELQEEMRDELEWQFQEH